MPEPDELEHRTPEPVVPHEKFPEGRIGAPAGWCAPAAGIADLPKMSVPRGGVQWPSGEEVRQMEAATAHLRAFERRAKIRADARRDFVRLARFALTLAAVLYVLTLLAIT